MNEETIHVQYANIYDIHQEFWTDTGNGFDGYLSGDGIVPWFEHAYHVAYVINEPWYP